MEWKVEYEAGSRILIATADGETSMRVTIPDIRQSPSAVALSTP